MQQASRPEQAPRSSADRPRADAEAGGPSPPANETRVLLIEDNDDGRETLLALLDAMGYKAAGAADGPSALELARRFVPHVVLLDLGLPGMDGYEVARALRAEAALKDTHIVALTGWGAEKDRERTAQAGFDHHLTKPVELAALDAYLEQFRR